jgi:hypothetical protein
MVNWNFLRKPIEAIHIPHHKEDKDKGTTDTQMRWTDKQSHPNLMSRYDEFNNDPEVDIALDLLTDLVAGVGFYTEMPEEIKPEHPNKKTIDDYCERINADEKFKQITRTTLGKGFCPVEVIGDYDLKILPPESFYIWKTNKGMVYRYTQEVNSSEVARWDKNELGKILLFINEEDTSHPYGQALTDSIGDLLEIRKEMNEDIGKALHRYAWPKRVHRFDMTIQPIKDAFTDADIDEDIFLGNCPKDSFTTDTLEVNPNTKFQGSIEMIYYQIAEGLHAPLLLYLKNATEASATVMMESVDRFVNGFQRYLKRRIERFLFEPQCGDPVPRVVWGQPKTGLEKVTLTELASIINSPRVAKNQAQTILKQFFPNLPEPEFEPVPQPLQTNMPFQKQQPQQISTEQLLEKLNDLQTGLDIIETNYLEHKLTLVEAVTLADRTMSVYYKRTYPDSWKEKRDETFETFSRKLLGTSRTEEKWEVTRR